MGDLQITVLDHSPLHEQGIGTESSSWKQEHEARGNLVEQKPWSTNGAHMDNCMHTKPERAWEVILDRKE